MKPKRIFRVYPEHHTAERGPLQLGPWRWRLIASRNGQIVAGSQESFDSRGNAMRAARREASLYPPGVAAVEVQA